MASALAKRCAKKFKRIAALNDMQDNGDAIERLAAGTAKRAMPNTWVKRKSNNVAGFWDRKAAKQ